jgi:uncharacterized protein (DUF983 family)
MTPAGSVPTRVDDPSAMECTGHRQIVALSAADQCGRPQCDSGIGWMVEAKSGNTEFVSGNKLASRRSAQHKAGIVFLVMATVVITGALVIPAHTTDDRFIHAILIASILTALIALGVLVLGPILGYTEGRRDTARSRRADPPRGR